MTEADGKNKGNIFSKSFLGNANNELNNILYKFGLYQYCSIYKPEYETTDK